MEPGRGVFGGFGDIPKFFKSFLQLAQRVAVLSLKTQIHEFISDRLSRPNPIPTFLAVKLATGFISHTFRDEFSRK